MGYWSPGIFLKWSDRTDLAVFQGTYKVLRVLVSLANPAHGQSCTATSLLRSHPALSCCDLALVLKEREPILVGQRLPCFNKFVDFLACLFG